MADPLENPDILLLVTDQMRGDCLGCAGHPVLQTPHLDWLASEGIRFTNAYSECPVCIPARRTLMTARFPANHGVVINYNASLAGPTLPEVLSRHGYQTHLSGKLHLHPARKRYGFMSADWADSPAAPSHAPAGAGAFNDYQRFLAAEGARGPRFSEAHGISSNSPISRPWHADERLHFTNWVTDKSIEFLERRDPTVPYFLKASYLHPHQPCTPPQVYYDRYMGMDLPERPVGDWARVFEGPRRDHHRDPWRVSFEPAMQRQFEAAYYGSINHIDDQINRILMALPRPANTLILFLSDHGEMLGDHQWIRKRTPWEGSACIPLIVRPPVSWGIRPGVSDAPVQIADVMPTLLAAAGIDIPDTVDGADLRPVIEHGRAPREFVHGECSAIPSLNSGMQYLTDGKRKYIWFPGRDEEQFFNLESDPQELNNLAGDATHSAEIEAWRNRLVEILDGRPEGFVQAGALSRRDGPTAPCLQTDR